MGCFVSTPPAALPPPPQPPPPIPICSCCNVKGHRRPRCGISPYDACKKRHLRMLRVQYEDGQGAQVMQVRYVENTPPLESDFVNFRRLVCSDLRYENVRFVLSPTGSPVLSAEHLYLLCRQRPIPNLHAIPIPLAPPTYEEATSNRV